MIPLHEPDLSKKDINAVVKTLKSGWVSTAGNEVNNFEKQISKKFQIKNVLATNSGTSSLFLALKVLDVKENDEVIVPTITFIASVNVIKYNLANPIS